MAVAILSKNKKKKEALGLDQEVVGEKFSQFVNRIKTGNTGFVQLYKNGWENGPSDAEWISHGYRHPS